MSVSVSSAPVEFPRASRFTTGTITWDSSYPDQGEAVSIAQWGGNSNGVPNRQPDFVIFNDRIGGAADTSARAAYFRTNSVAAKVQLFGDSAIATDGLAQLDEGDDVSTARTDFIAVWVEPNNPAGVTVV